MICLIVLLVAIVALIIWSVIYHPEPGPYGAFEQWREDAKKSKEEAKKDNTQ